MTIDTSSMQVVESGETKLAIGPIEWFELNGHRFDRSDVFYSLSTNGPLADDNIQGNIGVEFLKPFRLILDYRNARMSLMPLEK